MASNKKLTVWAVVLFSVLCAASATPPCYLGGSIPYFPLRSCHTYVVSKICGEMPPPTSVLKDLCCRELSDMIGMCRCDALRIFMDGGYDTSGAFVGGLIRDRPGCPREVQRRFAATIITPAECDLGGPCPGLV